MSGLIRLAPFEAKSLVCRIGSAAHVLATESVKRAARARFDRLEHCGFFRRSGNGRLVRELDPSIARIMADCGEYVMPHLSTATRYDRDFPQLEKKRFPLKTNLQYFQQSHAVRTTMQQ